MRSLVLGIVAVTAATAAWAQNGAPSLKIFGGFAPGLYAVEGRDAESRAKGADGRSICVMSPASLIRDGAAPGDGCGYTVIEDIAKSATVTYSCKVGGGGRTTLSVVDDHLRVEAQGFRNKDPFEVVADYRRVGDCPGK